jgi:hypothetical protein
VKSGFDYPVLDWGWSPSTLILIFICVPRPITLAFFVKIFNFQLVKQGFNNIAFGNDPLEVFVLAANYRQSTETGLPEFADRMR